MANDEPKVKRTLHLRFTMSGADPEQLSAMMRASAPFYQAFGNASLTLLRNADDPAKFVQVIEYEAPESFELNRQWIAGDMRFQTYLPPGVPCCPARSRSTCMWKSN